MHTGKVKKIIIDRGFGFIHDTDGRELFFHQSSMLEGQFRSLKEDDQLEFNVENSPKGPCAIDVRLINP